MHALRQYRKDRGLSLDEMAGKVETSKATLHRLETGKQRDMVDLVLLRKLVAETGIPAERLHLGLAEMLKQAEPA